MLNPGSSTLVIVYKKSQFVKTLPRANDLLSQGLSGVDLSKSDVWWTDTLTALREKYWILQGRQTVKMYNTPMCDLSKIETPSLFIWNFTWFALWPHIGWFYTGIDFVGPLYVHVQGNDESEHKTYICLFMCASTRAIHLEPVRSLNVDQFLLHSLTKHPLVRQCQNV